MSYVKLNFLKKSSKSSKSWYSQKNWWKKLETTKLIEEKLMQTDDKVLE